ncbi:crotonase/enoyl-CoA hydratase family protein [Pseudorhodobacter ferrugineus]|uniref:crotonase/enoyl-CoA hydratase family protein n=1 Tax=Pseudorhodobacter ferrugineus TaxID=77008 RepID=UPI0003B4AB58|nr:crotonase/enoyl-CoA hydratase family protein [Pseudorhodobacter ferrugineus]
MTYDTLRLEVDPRGVATLTLARPDKRNAMSAKMIAELTDAAQALGADRAVRVVILAAQGDSFCAGGDLAWMQDQMAADGPTRAAEARKLAMMLAALNSLPKPLIGRVQGQAYGGGVGLMSVCDVAIGVAEARFGLTETRLGLIPATIGPYVIARMGAAHARRVFASARIFDADEAVQLGLLARVVWPGDLDAAIQAEVKPYLSCAPGAVAEAKALIRTLQPMPTAADIEASIAALVTRWESPEATLGINAFFTKEKPDWAQ